MQTCIMNNKAASVTIIVCIIISTALCFIEAIDITIVNNENETGVDNSSCLVGNIHCSALDFVFSNLSDCHSEPYNVLILGGNYDFNLNSTVTDNLFKNCPAINITGESTDRTNIVCGMDAGFAFHNVPQVKIANITFTNCGSLRNSTSVNITNSTNTTLRLSTALYFTYCKNVQIINVIVQNSNSTGVVMYNTYGELFVEGSTFKNNSKQGNHSLPSNGGFYIEFVYCNPGMVENCVQKDNSNATYTFKSSNFRYNYALNTIGGTLFYLPYQRNYYSFGRGGGLSIVFKGNAYNNLVLIDNCTFYRNTAAWGGGLLVEFEDFSKHNKMNISNTNFCENEVIVDAQNGYGTSGGGVRVGFVIFKYESVEFNSLFFENCSFAKNKALWGGGFGMYMPSEPNVTNATNSLSFINCNWTGNIALLGSAIDLDFWHIYTAGAKMQVEFSACKFYNNENREDIDVTVNKPWSEFSSFGTGALYANGMPIVFEESVEFSNNTGSALAIYDTIVRFADGCYASFINNSAWEGGAIVMLGASQLWIYPQTEFLFKMNKAKLRGGAIYALQTSRHDLLSGGNCFLHYYDLNVSSHDEWKTKFHFENNTAPTGSSIFATTLLSCAWGASFGDLNFTLLNVLNWSNFTYTPKLNSNTIATEASKININASASTPTEIIPGKHTALPITIVDDKNNNISRSLWLVSNDTSVQVSSQLTDNSVISLQGMPNSKASIRIVTDGSRITVANLPIKLAECPPGYYLDVDKNKTCQCSYLSSSQRLDGILSCDSETFTAKIRRGYWAGYHLSSKYPVPNDSNLVTGQCPKHYCHVSEQDIFLPNESNITLLNEMLCSPANRNGTLCGRCSNGYAVAINSFYFDCVKCSHQQSQHGWIIYALTEYVPSTLLFCIVLFFDVNLHSGTISAIILYFQIFIVLGVYADGDVNPPLNSSGILKGITFVYNIWNLQFIGFLLPLFCLSQHFNTMDILLIKYISGFYPFLLFVLFLIFINVYVNCCGLERMALCLRYIRNCCIRFKIKITRKGSTVNGLATLWTLVFAKFALISSLILSRENLTGSKNSGITVKVAWLDGNMPLYGKQHLPYVIPAVFVLGFLVIIPALGLLCHPLVPQIMGSIQKKCKTNFNQYKPYRIMSSALEKPFIRLKPLIDCFQGSCKERCEFYAGLLMCYRLIMIFLFSFTIRANVYFYSISVSVIFVIITAAVQPYKKHHDNIITILCISNIILINLITICHLYYSETQVNTNLQPVLWLQLVLVSLPFAFFVVFVSWRSWGKFKAFWRQEPLYAPINRDDRDELDDFPRRALEDSDADSASNIGSASPRLESAYGTFSPQGSSQTSNKGNHAAGDSGGGSLLSGNTTDDQ